MASVRKQILDVVELKLETVRAALGWLTVARDPRELIGEDEMNAILLGSGGDREPDSLTGQVETHVMDFEVGLVVIERDGDLAEDLLDAGYVAISDALLNPADIQLGALAVDIRRGEMSPPFIGRGKSGARIVGVQSIGFMVSYWAREGDASNPAP
ncbi:MAG: hypothetical protein FP826_09295 [Sphingomonadales bacterium]|nr:hypothetical protein [Sphingomonadales bacterium]MBU3991566.1 hypothetical protein [Alphaproteobacteria bacterium]